jgi:hypothetical protein
MELCLELYKNILNIHKQYKNDFDKNWNKLKKIFFIIFSQIINKDDVFNIHDEQTEKVNRNFKNEYYKFYDDDKCYPNFNLYREYNVSRI